MKINRKNIPFILGLLVLSLLTLSACTASTTANTETTDPTTTEAASLSVENDAAEQIEVVASKSDNGSRSNNVNGLTDAEIAGLIFMREEEKLARDVYLALYDQWNLPIFQNIADSEQTHTDSVKQLLDTFGIADPAEDAAQGVFTNPDLHALYDELVALGSQSLADALKVGAAIEEIDILDLRENLEGVTEKSIRQVYENLLSGSENHLRAFVSTLAQKTSETYEPQYLTVEDYNAIISETGQRGGQGSGGNSRKP